jgi:tetratricopeptide (TPR) repeat protein
MNRSRLIQMVAALVAGLALLILPVSPGTAWAADGNKAVAKRHYRRAVSDYNLGRFEDAIGEFEKAYELDPAPTLLWNIAQAHRKLGHAERAIFFYRRYLDEAPDAKDRGDVEKRIRELDEQLRREAPAPNPVLSPPPAAPAPPSAPSPPSGQSPVNAPPTEAVTTAPRTRAPSDGSGLRAAGLVTAGAGVVVVGVGLVFGLKAKSDSDSVSQAPRFDASKYDSGRRAESIQWICYGVGGAALVTGGILYLVGQNSSGGEKTSLAPTFSAHGAALTLRGAF